MSRMIEKHNGNKPWVLQPAFLTKVGLALHEFSAFDIEDSSRVARMSRWRNSNLRWFLDQSPTTIARTRGYVRSIVHDSNRRMFWLQDSDGAVFGHFGFKILTTGVLELDNFIIGEKLGFPGIALECEKAILNFGMRNDGAKQYHAIVAAANFSAMRNHMELGFFIQERLVHQDGRGFVRLLMHCDEFSQKFPGSDWF